MVELMSMPVTFGYDSRTDRTSRPMPHPNSKIDASDLVYVAINHGRIHLPTLPAPSSKNRVSSSVVGSDPDNANSSTDITP
jgi:hypothetical protein